MSYVYIKSEEGARQYKQVPKNHDFPKIKIQNDRLDRFDLQTDLIGRSVNTNETDTYGERIHPIIAEVYPHMVMCKYEVIKELDGKAFITGPFRVCYSTADLIEKGIISFQSGRAEMVTHWYDKMSMDDIEKAMVAVIKDGMEKEGNK